MELAHLGKVKVQLLAGIGTVGAQRQVGGGVGGVEGHGLHLHHRARANVFCLEQNIFNFHKILRNTDWFGRDLKRDWKVRCNFSPGEISGNKNPKIGCKLMPWVEKKGLVKIYRALASLKRRQAWVKGIRHAGLNPFFH